MKGAPLIVTVAPNGARRTKADHPALPMTPPEITRTAQECMDVGAAMIHLHVRGRDGGHSLDPDAYRTAIQAIRDAVGDGLIVQASTEAVGLYKPEQQIAMVRDLRPEAVSLAIRELAPDAGHESRAAGFFSWLVRERIMVQYILYSPQDLSRFIGLVKKGVVPNERLFVLYVLGRYGAGKAAEPGVVPAFLAAAEEGGIPLTWAVCAFGAREGVCVLEAAALGGHARVGFENNLILNDGETAPDNAALVVEFMEGAHCLGRPVVGAHEARSILLPG